MMMQFVCTARSADDEDYRPLAETPLTLDFAYDHGVSTLADPAVWQVTLTNNADAPWRGVVKLEHCVACDAPRFFLPGFLYGRNRGEAVAGQQQEGDGNGAHGAIVGGCVGARAAPALSAAAGSSGPCRRWCAG